MFFVSKWRILSSNYIMSSSESYFLASNSVFECGLSYFVNKTYDLDVKILSFGTAINDRVHEINVSALEKRISPSKCFILSSKYVISSLKFIFLHQITCLSASYRNT